MGFLHKLWDETLAGPMPDTGLSKLRKYNSFSGTPSLPSPQPPTQAQMADDHQVQVSRSITILSRTSSNPLVRNLSIDVPASDPADSSSRGSTPNTPVTPGTPAEKLKRTWTRTKSVDAGRTASKEGAEQRSPTVYDWIVISGLDR